MLVNLPWGRNTLELEINAAQVVPERRAPIALPVVDLAGAVSHALENPFDFPALRRALTPDDHVAIVVDEHLPRLPELLVPLLEHLQSARVEPSAVTLLCAPHSANQPWADALPEAFEEVHIEIHQPGDRKQLSYLATTKQGRRIYLNRTAVDADQLILLTGRGYDPVTGISGAESALFPGLSDEATIKETAGRINLDAPGEEAWPLRQEAVEVAWLLGAPFLVQVIEGEDDKILHVLAGPVASSTEGQRLLNERWRIRCDSAADLVIAGTGGDPDRHTFVDLARAFFCAARAVKPGGRIALLTDARPDIDQAAAVLRGTDDPAAALKALAHDAPGDRQAAVLWASAAQKAHLYLLSRLDTEAVEELFATPLKHAGEVGNLLKSASSVIVIPDAHKSLTVVEQ